MFLLKLLILVLRGLAKELAQVNMAVTAHSGRHTKLVVAWRQDVGAVDLVLGHGDIMHDLYGRAALHILTHVIAL